MTADAGRSLVLIVAWIEAWEARDAAALNDLFAPDAHYESALHGPLTELPRHLRIACRAWRQIRITPLQNWEVEGGNRITGAYRFEGIDREEQHAHYEADVVMMLRAVAGERLQVTAFKEVLRRASP